MSLPSSPGSEDFAAFLDAELQSETNSDSEGHTTSHESDQEQTIIGKKRKQPENETSKLIPTVDSSSDDQVVNEQNGMHMKKNCPPHPGFIWDVCIRCGMHKPADDSNGEDGVALRYIHQGLEVSRLEADRIRGNELERVLSNKKLYLVLDLDHTLLNSARFAEVTPDEYAYLCSVYCSNQDINATDATYESEEKPQSKGSSLHNLQNLHMWTKLRPFVHQFLEAAGGMYEMYVYTMGERIYAQAMARLLDPSGRFFGSRVISQNDSTCRTTKDLDIMLGSESAVVILDDTEGVWPKHRENLVLMERYHFFGSSCKQFGIASASLLEAEKDESEHNGTLANTLDLLRRVHSAYFEGKYQDETGETHYYKARTDVREIIQSIRSRVLAGCKLIFSRIFPTSLASPQTHQCWRLAETLGAICTTSLDSSVTHVVALDKGTEKSKWALENKCHLVHPRWIDAALYTWKRPSEEDYSVVDAPMRTTYSETISKERPHQVLAPPEAPSETS